MSAVVSAASGVNGNTLLSGSERSKPNDAEVNTSFDWKYPVLRGKANSIRSGIIYSDFSKEIECT